MTRTRTAAIVLAIAGLAACSSGGSRQIVRTPSGDGTSRTTAVTESSEESETTLEATTTAAPTTTIPTYSIDLAIEGLKNAKNITYKLETGAGVQHLGYPGVFEPATGMFEIIIPYPPQVFDGVETIVDPVGQMLYMESASFNELAGTNITTKYVKAPLASASDGQVAFVETPTAFLKVFEQAATRTDKGLVDDNGEQHQQWAFAVKLKELITANPALGAQFPKEALAQLPEQGEYNVFVTEDNRIARISLAFNLGGIDYTTDLKISAIDAAEPIAIPAEADVSDGAAFGIGA